MRPAPQVDSWRRMVLQSMPPVAWLAQDAPHNDVVLSSRCRFMRNLVGRKFPHTLSPDDLREVAMEIMAAVQRCELPLEPLRGLTQAERDYLVGCRLVSPDFLWQEPGRALLLDKGRSVALMINEEDHLRLQAVTAGWSIETARIAATGALDTLSKRLDFAYIDKFGFLAASPYNAGPGRRLSAMFHLIGLAQAKRLPAVLQALAEKGLAARGLFGESSRAVGAYVQVSVIGYDATAFAGACDYLLKEERAARRLLSAKQLGEQVERALRFAQAQRTISLADALRVLAWTRWAAGESLPGAPKTARDVDSILTKLELRSEDEEGSASEIRADYLRKSLGL